MYFECSGSWFNKSLVRCLQLVRDSHSDSKWNTRPPNNGRKKTLAKKRWFVESYGIQLPQKYRRKSNQFELIMISLGEFIIDDMVFYRVLIQGVGSSTRNHQAFWGVLTPPHPTKEPTLLNVLVLTGTFSARWNRIAVACLKSQPEW